MDCGLGQRPAHDGMVVMMMMPGDGQRCHKEKV